MNKKFIAIVAIIALIAILTVCLVACNAKSYEKKLEKAGYYVYVADEDDIEDYCDMFGVDDDSIKWAVFAEKGTDVVYIAKFKKISDAKDAEEELEKLKMTKLTVKRSSSIVFFGTEDAIDDAK